jgi:DNA replication protein DnaC
MNNKRPKQQSLPSHSLDQQLSYLKLSQVAQNYAPLATTAAHKDWTHIDYLTALVKQEAAAKKDRATQRRIRLARFPVIKTLDQFIWSWPDKINRPQVENLFHLNFIKDKANAIFLGGVGLGKTHLATALAYTACLEGITVLFTTAIDVVNALTVAQASGRFQLELKKYLKTELLVLDELGYLPPGVRRVAPPGGSISARLEYRFTQNNASYSESFFSA